MTTTPILPRPTATDLTPRDRTERIWAALVLALIVLIGAALRVTDLTRESLWLDEAMSYVYSGQSLRDIWSWTRPLDPYYPPGYYTILHVWTALFGTSELALRGLSLLASVATLPMVYLAGRLAHSRNAGLFAAGLMALAGYQVEYAQEARSYALIGLVAAVAIWAVLWLSRYPRLAAARLRGNRARWVWAAYVVANAAALLLHNTGFLVWVAMIGAGVLAWGVRLRTRSPSWLWRFMQANVLILLLWMLTWLPVFIRQGLTTSASSSLARVPPTPARVWYGLRDLAFVQFEREPTLVVVPSSTGIVFDLLALTLLVAGAVLVTRHAHRMVLVTAAVLPIVVSLGVSLLLTPIFVTNTLLWVSIPFAVLMATTLAHVSRRWPITLLPAVALVLATVLTTVEYLDTVAKEPWRQVAEVIADNAQPGDLIVISADYVRHPLHYYLDDHDLAGVRSVAIDYEPTIESVRFAIPAAERIWLVYAHDHFADPNGYTPQVIEERAVLAEEYLRWSADVRLMRFETTAPASVTGSAAGEGEP